jgi:hypothetical protein
MAAVGRKLPRSKPTLCRLLEPLAVHHIGLPARDVLDVTRVDENHVEAPGFMPPWLNPTRKPQDFSRSTR